MVVEIAALLFADVGELLEYVFHVLLDFGLFLIWDFERAEPSNDA